MIRKRQHRRVHDGIALRILTSIKENFTVEDNDEVMSFLQNSVIDEDKFLRYRISERFNGFMKSLFDAHKKEGMPPEQTEVINDMKQLLQIYMAEKGMALLIARLNLLFYASRWV